MLQARLSRALVVAAALSLLVLGAHSAQAQGVDLPLKSNDFTVGTQGFIENLGQWNGAAKFHTVKYANLYPGIDADFTGIEERRAQANIAPKTASDNPYAMEVTYALAPGADPSAIKLLYEGADSLAIDGSGQLVVKTSLTDITEILPIGYQVAANGNRHVVNVGFALDGTEVSFNVGAFDHTRDLYIDPIVKFSRSFGGTGTDSVADMHEDASGRYFSGVSTSPACQRLLRRVNVDQFPDDDGRLSDVAGREL